MAIPTFTSITPDSGPAGGRSTAVIAGTGFRVAPENGKTVRVSLDGVEVPFERMGVDSATEITIEVPPFRRTGTSALVAILPPVDIRIANLDDNEDEISGEVVTAADAYTHQRAPLLPPGATDANQHYRKIVLEMLHTFHRQVLANTAIGTSIDYGEFGKATIASAKMPAIAITGPRFTENMDVRHQWLDLPEEGDGGDPETFQKKWHGYTVDMSFDLVIGAKRRAEIYALTQAVIEMFLRTPWIEIPVVPGDPNGDKHQFPLVLINAPNIGFQDMDSDLMTATGLFEVRWVPIRLPEAFQVGVEILEGALHVSPLDDPDDFEVVPFATEDPP